jgi:Copper-binding of amyloid precursor, CuBD
MILFSVCLLLCVFCVDLTCWCVISEGPFQSDALLVPETCLFDHIHNQTKCWEFALWNQTAALACQSRDMTLRSFAMLLPCGISLFNGVEFVCCPKHAKGERQQLDVTTRIKISSSFAFFTIKNLGRDCFSLSRARFLLRLAMGLANEAEPVAYIKCNPSHKFHAALVAFPPVLINSAQTCEAWGRVGSMTHSFCFECAILSPDAGATDQPAGPDCLKKQSSWLSSFATGRSISH